MSPSPVRRKGKKVVVEVVGGGRQELYTGSFGSVLLARLFPDIRNVRLSFHPTGDWT